MSTTNQCMSHDESARENATTENENPTYEDHPCSETAILLCYLTLLTFWDESVRIGTSILDGLSHSLIS